MKELSPSRGPLRARCRVPGDKSISHRVALMAPLAEGPSRVRGWLDAEDTRRSLAAVTALGAEVRETETELVIGPGSFPGRATKAGCSARRLTLDCGNSGTTARLLLGLLAGRDVRVRLEGDESLSRRPMARVFDPLAELGAGIFDAGQPGLLPLDIDGRPLHGGDVAVAVRSAQVKSALLLAGLGADTPVTVRGAGGTRDHTERLLELMGAEVATEDPTGDIVRVVPGPVLRPFDVTVPGDPSSAAFLIAAALVVPESSLTVEGILLSPSRSGFLDVLESMGANLLVRPADAGAWEPTGDVHVEFGPLKAFHITEREVPSLIDELPVLAILATRAEGTSTVTGAADLRFKESDRIASVASGLRRLGVDVREQPDGFSITGPCPLLGGTDEPAIVETAGDHRLAMSFAVAALASEGRVGLDDAECVAISWPAFFSDLDAAMQGF